MSIEMSEAGVLDGRLRRRRQLILIVGVRQSDARPRDYCHFIDGIGEMGPAQVLGRSIIALQCCRELLIIREQRDGEGGRMINRGSAPEFKD